MIKKGLKTGLLVVFLMFVMSFDAFAIYFPQGEIGWFEQGGIYFRDNLSWSNYYPLPLHSKWRWLNIKGNNDLLTCYYINDNGFILRNTTTPDGYTVDEQGRWTVNGVVQTKEVSTDYTKPVLDRTIYDSDGLAYAVKDIMTMNPNDSIAKYGAMRVEQYPINNGTVADHFRIAYSNGMNANVDTAPDGSNFYTCSMGLGVFEVRGDNMARAHFAYAPEPHSPANLYLDEAIKYFEKLGYKHVELTENIKDREFYTINGIYPGKAPDTLKLVIGNYIVSFNYWRSLSMHNVVEIAGIDFRIQMKDLVIKQDLNDLKKSQ